MPSRVDVERLRRANADIERMALDRLERFWRPFADRPALGRAALREYLPILTREFGDLAASVAVEWYDEMRAKAGYTGSWAQPAPTITGDSLARASAWSTQPLDADDAASAIGRTAQVVSRYVLQPGRDTIAQNAGRDGVTWARVPTGAETCAFCLLLASRGFAYLSEHTASASRDGTKYHGQCDCVAVPDWSDDPRLDGYDPDALYEKYQAARSLADSGDLRAILSAGRKEFGTS